jgi:hypothetical protein
MAVCDEIITTFPTHYTAYWYKFRILEQIGYDADSEIALTSHRISKQPKSYQAWHYRRWLVDRLPSAPDELPLLRATFTRDAKNFHAWQYAVWYAGRWDRRQEIFDLAKEQIAEDCRNNSAWTVRRTIGEMIGVDREVEFEETIASLRVVGKNEAACNFLMALANGDERLEGRVRAVGEELIQRSPENRFALVLLLAVATDPGEIAKICDALIQNDPVRLPYYEMVKQGLIKPFS